MTWFLEAAQHYLLLLKLYLLSSSWVRVSRLLWINTYIAIIMLWNEVLSNTCTHWFTMCSMPLPHLVPPWKQKRMPQRRSLVQPQMQLSYWTMPVLELVTSAVLLSSHRWKRHYSGEKYIYHIYSSAPRTVSQIQNHDNNRQDRLLTSRGMPTKLGIY